MTAWKPVLRCRVSSDLPSDILPNDEVLDLIGRGGMGVVCKARQVSLDRIVAIKLLPRAQDDDEFNFAILARCWKKLEYQELWQVRKSNAVDGASRNAIRRM